MADPYTLGNRLDLAIGAASFNVLNGVQGNKLTEDSLVTAYFNRESVDVTMQFLIGNREAYAQGPAAINATIGDMPIIPDDFIVKTLGKAQDEMFLNGTNVNAAAQEIGFLIQVIALKDLGFVPTLGEIPVR